jgi:hypothetical protein
MIISVTTSRSLWGRSAQTCWLGIGRMVTPPSGGPSLEGGDQRFNGGDGQDRGLGAGFGGEIGAGDGDVGDHAGEDFDLTVADMTREAGESRQFERLAEERMTGIGDGDFSLTFLRDQRGITLGEVSPLPADPAPRPPRRAPRSSPSTVRGSDARPLRVGA